MPDRSRSPGARRRASFARAERLRREAGDVPRERATGQKAPPRPTEDRPPRQAKQAGRSAPRHDRQRRPTPLHQIRDRIERADAAADRRQLARLKEQTRAEFGREAERRRDSSRRVEHDRKRDALQAKERRLEEHQRRANLRRLERTRGEMKKEFARVADRRRDAGRRAEMARAQALAQQRRQEMERRAAADIERDQKRRAQDQRDEHRRQTDAMRTRHKVERNSFRLNEVTAAERHHARIKGIDGREERELADFDGRRKGLAGRVAELVPGRRAEMDERREGMVRSYEAERLAQHRDHEAFKERAFANEMQRLRDQAQDRKLLMELHRDDRSDFARQQEADRPRLIEDRARLHERAEQAREDREREALSRDNVRPTPEFSAAASGHAREHIGGTGELTREPARDMSPPAREFERT